MTVVRKISAFELQGPTMNPSSHVPVLYTVPYIYSMFNMSAKIINVYFRDK